MLRTSPMIGANAPYAAFHSDAKAERLFNEHRKLSGSARNHIHANPRMALLGEDPVVDHLVAGAGFGTTDLVVLRVAASGRLVTAICVPTRLWREPHIKSRLLEIKDEAKELRTTCILVPQRWMKAPTRSSIARTIAAARNTQYTRSQLDQVLDHVREARISTLMDAASAIVAHDDPISVVLALTAKGLIDIDRSTPLHGGTWISTRV